MTAPIVTEASRQPYPLDLAPDVIFDGDNGVRFRHLRRIDGLLWARVAQARTAFKEERNA